MEIIPEAAPAGMLAMSRTMPTIRCCKCGVPMESNPANMCVSCLQSEVDITDGISKEVILHQCRGCARYLRPGWVAAELESVTLLAICLKKINGLSKVHLVNACFLWTEPHSRRLRVKLTIQKEVLRGAVVQTSFPVEFILQNQQCDACQRSYTDHTWRAMVQARQKVDHKRTFYLLEQLILRYRAHEKCISVEQVPAGVDFAFGERSHAVKFIEFLSSVVPIRSKTAKQLISEDIHTATKNYKFSYAVELVPLCRDDLVVLPARTAASLGSISALVLVQRVSNHIFFVDPRTLQMAEMNAEKYWMDPFRALLSSERLEEFTVLDVTPVTIAPLTGAALRRKQKVRRGRPGSSVSGSERGTDPRVSGSSVAGSVAPGDKRRRGSSGPTVDEVDDSSSTMGASSVAGGKMSRAGGFTGAVSLAGGSIAFHGASSVASTVTGGYKGRMLLADIEVMKTRDMGFSDQRYVVRSHLGNILRPGDFVMGYDLTNAVYNDMDAETTAIGGRNRTKGTAGRAARLEMPDIVLVKKAYPKKGEKVVSDVDMASTVTSRAGRRAAARSSVRVEGETEMADAPGATDAPVAAASAASKQRIWKLKRFDDVLPTTHSDMTRKGDEERAAADYEAFLRDIESDPVLRKSINLYKDQAAIEARAAAIAAAQAARDAAAALRLAPAASGVPAATLPAAAGDDEEGYDGGDIDITELLDDMGLDDKAASAADAAAAARAFVDPEDAAFAAAAASAAAPTAREEEVEAEGEWEHPGSRRRAGVPAAAAAAPAIEEAEDEDEEEEASEDDV